MERVRKRSFGVLCVLLVTAAFPAWGQASSSEWPEGSAMAVGEQHVKTRDYFAAQLEQQHAALLALLAPEGDSRLIEGLKAQHAQWLKYRVAECEVSGALTGAGGSWPSTYAVECEARLTDRRFRRVRAAVACLRKAPAADRGGESSRCLQQLLPLSNDSR